VKHRKLEKTVLFVAFIAVFMPSVVHAGGVIQLPKTGQTKCYDSAGAEITCTGTGQDGNLQAGAAWPNPRFTPGTGAEAECMIDNLTGLMWPKSGNLPNGVKIWNDAIDYANNLTLCGHDDWRLPNINELESLENDSQSNSGIWLNTQGFTNVQSVESEGVPYWSSTTDASDTDYAMVVYMWSGGQSRIDKFGPDMVTRAAGYVWPVRTGQSGSFGNSVIWRTGQNTSYRAGDDGDLKQGTAWPSPRFTDQGNGEVTDNLTGLVWTKDANAPGPSACSPAAGKTREGALDYVKCLNTQNYLGHTDWRLPNRKELHSLSDYSQYQPTLPAGHPFIGVQPYSYWSSTTYAHWTDYAWVVGMWYGGMGYSYNSSYYAWPVRDGLSGPSPVNGACGSANGGTFISAPANNFCSAGTASSVSGSGPWTWSCAGSGGGTDASCSAIRQQPTQTLTVTKSGAGSGSVAANTGTISWTGNTGTASYNSGTSVTLTASAALGSTFTGWSGGCSGTGTCGVTMDAAKSVTAAFGITPAPISGACGSSDSGTFASAPASNLCSAGSASSVSGSGPWTWSCTGSNGGTNASCSASLQQQTSFTLTVTKLGTGSGSLTANAGTIGWIGLVGTASYNSGASVTLTAAADTGSTFTGWSGGGCSGTGNCAVTMDSAKNVAAAFTLTSPGPSGLIRLPKTGQTTSYYAGDDGNLQRGAAWPDPRFNDNGNGTVNDNLTGLVWTKDANAPGPAACSPGAGKTWADALTYVACLNTNNYLGHNDWRLPNVNELYSLTDFANYNPALPTGHPFSNAASDWYWSSTAYIACYSTFALNVLMQYGDMSYQNKFVPRLVWPVRGQCTTGSTACVPKTGQTASCAPGDDGALQAGVSWPANRFIDHNDGTVTDNLTGMMWLKDANCMKTSYPSFDNSLTYGDGAVTRQMALNFVAGINTGQYANCRAGHSDWRLPNINELNSLLDRSKNNPDLPEGYPFLNVQTGYVSSTARAVTTSNPWGVSFENGGVGAGDGAVWPVRSAPLIRRLTVAVSGAGAVTSDPAGIACGSDCSENYAAGTSVTLTVTPSPGSAFLGWSGSGCSGTGTCSLTLNADTTVTAAFTKMPVGKGDINYDGQVNMTDAVLAMQISAGMPPAQKVYKEADANSDGNIGLPEAVYVMQRLAVLRTTLLPPASLSAVAGDGQVTLSWPSVTGAASYNVYYRNATGVTTANGTKVSGLSSGSTISGLANGSTYYFIVTALSGALESDPSVEVASSLLLKWSYQIDVGTGWQSAVYVSPALGADGTVYIGNNLDAKVVAMNPDGTQKWEFLAAPNIYPGANLTRPLALGTDGTIYISSGNRKIFAINPDGTPKWEHTFPDTWGMSSGIAISYDGSTLYSLGQSGNLYAVKALDGTQLWAFTTGDGGGNMYSAPVVGQDGTIYFGGGGYNSPNKKLYAINPDGTFKWAFSTGGIITAPPSIGTDGTLYICSQDGHLYAVNPDGTQKWRYNVGIVYNGTAAIDSDGNVYIGGSMGGFYSLDSAGKLRWTFTTNGGLDITPLIGNDGNIYIVTKTGYLYCLSKAGAEIWKLNVTAGTESSPLMDANGVLYFGNYDGKIYAVQTTATGIDLTAQWPIFGGNVKHSGRQK